VVSEHYVSDLSLLKADAYDVKISVIGFEPMIYGSDSVYATHYTTAPLYAASTSSSFDEVEY